MNESMSPVVRCNGIVKSYPGKPPVDALKEMTFDVSQGEIFGLIGPDGAGKTTLFRMIATLAVPDKGTIDIAGYDSVRSFREIRNMIGYMPGRFSLYQDLSVQENLDFFASVFGTRVETNYHLIKDIYIQLEPFKSRKAGKLSGGMKQKLALCCALIHKPELLILDEPTTGVDPVSRKEFWDMLGRLKQQGITIIVSTPYMDEATLCDRIALIQSGTVLKIDKPSGIIENYPQTVYAARSQDNYSLLEQLRTMPGVNSSYIFGDSLHVTFRDEDISLIDRLKQQNVMISPIKPSVEDCFIELMNKP